MRMNGFWRFFKVFMFALFSSFMGLMIICGPTVDFTVIAVAVIFGLGLNLAYFIGKKGGSTQHKARIVEKSLYGQYCFAVEIDGILLPELTWIPMMPETTAKIRDIIPCDEILLIRVDLYITNGTLLQVRKIKCGLPPHVHDNVPQ